MASGSGGAPASGGTQDKRVDRIEEGLAGIQTETGANSLYDANWPTYPLTPASLTTAGGANSNLVFTATPSYGGLIGNSISIAYVNPGGTNNISVSVSDYAITVSLGTSAGSITSTGAQVRTAVMGNAQANALVSVDFAAANNGTGVVSAFAATNLSGGTAATRATFDDGRGIVDQAKPQGQVDTQWENSGIDPWAAERLADPAAGL